VKNVVVMDIETDGLSLDSNVVLVGFKDIKSGEETILNVQRRGKERIKEKIKEIFKKYEIIVGYNIKDFDLKIIENFFDLRFYGKVIDLYYILKSKEGLLKKKFKNFKLRTVVKELELSELKGEIDYKILQKIMNNEETLLVYDYLRKDLRATKELFMYLNEYFKDFKKFLPEKDVENFNHFACNTGTFTYKFLCNRLGLEEKYDNFVKDGSYTGGYIMKPRVEYEEGDIYCLDFNSLYPHILMMGNLFSNGDWDGKIFDLKGRYDSKEWHKVSKELFRLYKLRRELKKQGNPKEHVLKIIINTIYGLTANSVFVNFYDKNIASDCTRIGRFLIKNACSMFEERGYKVLYGDTDSIYLKDEICDKEKLLEAKDEIIEDLKKMFPFPVETFDLGIDYEIKRIVFFAKKLYMFQSKDDELIIKGLPIIKDNATPLSFKVLENYIKPEFIKNGKYLFSFEEIKAWCYDLLRINKSLIGKSFNLKSLEYYKLETNIYYKLSKEYGDGIKIFVPNFKKGVGDSVKYVPMEEAESLEVTDLSIRSSLLELDYFCNEKKKLMEYIKNENKIKTFVPKEQETMERWVM
jgi:DNA polymerase elongation subunit (family B)